MRFECKAVLNSAAATVVERDGGKWLRVPVVSVVEGVLNWYLVLMENLKATVSKWIGKPVTIDHPPDSPEEAVAFLNDRNNVLGVIVESKIENNKLVNVVEIEYPGDTPLKRAVINAIEAGEVVEVSTGYFAYPEDNPGEYNGKQYQQVHHDIAPDHLAFLPGSRGACSIQDGCGANRVDNEMRDKARTPVYNGTETISADKVDFSIEAFVSAYNDTFSGNAPLEPKFESLTAEAKAWIASHTLLGDANATNFADLTAAPVVNPVTGKLNRASVIACFSDRRNQAALGAARRASLLAAASALLVSFDPTHNASAEPVAVQFELDLRHREEVVDRAIRDKFNNSDDGPWVGNVMVYMDQALFMLGEKLYRIPYTISEVEGVSAVALGERVEGALEFVPATGNAKRPGRSLVDWMKSLFSKNNGEVASDPATEPVVNHGGTMRKQLIEKLAEAMNIEVDVCNARFQEFKDCELKALVENAGKQAASNGDEPKPKQEPANNADFQPTREQILKVMPELQSVLEAQNSKATQVRNQAKENKDKIGLSGINDAVIEQMPVESLEILIKNRLSTNNFRQGDYSGVGGSFDPVHNAGGGDPFEAITAEVSGDILRNAYKPKTKVQ